MAFGQTLLLFFAESIFFIVVLSACLKFAARRHRNHLSTILEQVNKSGILKSGQEQEQEEEKLNSNEIRERLMKRIRKLQAKIGRLEGVEERYQKLKVKYNELKRQFDTAPSSTAATGTGDKKHVIEVGTTVDPERGVGPAYLNYLARKTSLNDAAVSSAKASHETKSYDKKIAEQRTLITSLQETIKKYETQAAIDGMKNENRENVLASLKQLEHSLADSQSHSDKLNFELDSIKRELQHSQNKVSQLEQERKEGKHYSDNPEDHHGNSYTIISRKNSDGSGGDGDPFDNRALANYNALEKEVQRLRENTTAQRQMIFTLEGQLVSLRKDLQDKELEAGERLEKELEIEKLERLLLETEGCVDVLESEVSYLQSRLTTIDNPEQPEPVEDNDEANLQIMKLTEKLEKARIMLNRWGVLREKLRNIVELGSHKVDSSLLEILSTRILDALEPLSINAHVRILTRHEQIDVANCGGIHKRQLELLDRGLSNKSDEILQSKDGFVIAYNKVGLFIQGDPERATDIGRLDDTLSFTLLLSDAIATTIDERQADSIRQGALKRLVEGVKKNLNNASIQSKYQSEEVRRIMENFVDELNNSLNTLNITENQSKFFAEMVDEVKARMEVLLATEVVVDSSFTELVNKLEKAKSI